jgi:hypothetical protein
VGSVIKHIANMTTSINTNDARIVSYVLLYNHERYS